MGTLDDLVLCPCCAIQTVELMPIPLEDYERKLVIASTPFLFSPGKYLDGRAVIFPFSYAVFLYCNPEN